VGRFEDEPMRIRALRVLEVIRGQTEGTGVPTFLKNVAQELGVDEPAAMPAFKYVADKRWIDTFSIPYTGRINAAGHDALEDLRRQEQESSTKSAVKAVVGAQAMDNTMEWDAFVSHAGEDKDQVARPLVQLLEAMGLRVWYDEATLTLGDSLARSIDAGLARSRFGVVVLSHPFFQKEWPQRELDGLVAREIGGVKIILPVWHEIMRTEIAAYSPTLADRLAAPTDKGLDYVAGEIARAIRQGAATLASRASATSSTGRMGVTIPSAIGSDLLREAKRYHADRTATILAKNGPVALMDGGALVVHVVPCDAIVRSRLDAFDKIVENPRGIFPIATGDVRHPRISASGLLLGSNAQGLSVAQRAYVQVSHSCRIEAVASSIARGRNREFVELQRIEAMFIEFTRRCVCALSDSGAAPPIAVAASLLSMENKRLVHEHLSSAFIPEDLPFGTIDSSSVDLGEAVFEEAPRSVNETVRILGPILKYLANVAGLRKSPNMDEAGKYLLTEAQIRDILH